MNTDSDNVSLSTSPLLEHKDKLVGVIGGLGPEATIDFLQLVMKHTPARIDQDHVRMLVYHDPRVPSRQRAILKQDSEGCGPRLAALALSLEQAGADFIVMPCNLGHYWEEEILASIHIPFVSIIDVTVSAVFSSCNDSNKKELPVVGLLTTPGCFHAGLYQQALSQAKCPVILPTEQELQETMKYVKQIKAGDKSKNVTKGLERLANALIARGAQVLIAACTELPLVLDPSMFDVPFVSSTEELAKCTVKMALGGTKL